MTNNHPVILFPKNYPVYHLANPQDRELAEKNTYGIGRYNEKRTGMYSTELFKGKSGQERNIHLGIDFFAPVGTPVYAYTEGQILFFKYNASAGDYGYTLVAQHGPYYALYGHLNKESIQNKTALQKIQKGEIIGWVGDRNENGGWTPHLHFQLSTQNPKDADMPGVVSEDQLAEALLLYPDPRIVLGPVY